nr:GMC family oxidoreductase [Bdellovibrio sp. HAGR004]
MNFNFDEIKSKVWDNLIIGTGMGGAAIGYSLAQQGQSVLFCEKGSRLEPNDGKIITGAFTETFYNESTTAIKREVLCRKTGRSFESILDISSRHKQHLFPMLGMGVGGSTSIYGMVLERFFPEDFKPSLFHGDNSESSAPDEWPIEYDDLLPYYEKCEGFFKVKGSVDYYKKNQFFNYQSPPKLSHAAENIVLQLKKDGLNPYILPKGYENVDECETCQGYLCAKNCKNNAWKVFIEPALSKHQAQLLHDCEVVKLESDDKTVYSALINYMGKRYVIRANRFILAAGAINSAKLLLKSKSPHYPEGLANKSKLVGKNLMRHLIDLYVLRINPALGNSGKQKEIGLNDFYIHEGVKYGNIQTFGRPPSSNAILEDLSLKNRLQGKKFISKTLNLTKSITLPIVENMFSGAMIFAATLEDWPYLNNKIFIDESDQLVINYNIHNSERKRITNFRKILLNKLSALNPKLIKFAHKNEMLGHSCGTCRFGNDPTTSVLDANNKAHDLENLYVVDASFFPTSSGTNPALTIAANALRVANIITNSKK